MTIPVPSRRASLAALAIASLIALPREARGDGGEPAASEARAAPVTMGETPKPPAQPVPSNPHLLFHPSGPGRGRLAIGVGLLIDQPLYATQGFLPIQPQLDLRLRYDLPAGFALRAQLSAIFIENTVTAGLSWSTPLPELPRGSIMIELSGGTQFGGLSGFGFDTFIVSPVIKPSLTLGWPMGDTIRWSLREEIALSRWQEVLSGGSWASNRQRDLFSGTTTMITIENLLERGGNAYFGAGAVLSRASQSLWLFFSQQSALVLYPRLIAGYVF